MLKGNRIACLLLASTLVLILSVPILGAPATIKKSVQALEGGNYLIKLVVTASKGGIYAFEIKDPKGAIVDVYAPKGWCMLSDGEVGLARTGGMPIAVGKSLEFLIYATAGDAQFVWTFFGAMEQMGKPEVL
jgi:hypothetical protein